MLLALPGMLGRADAFEPRFLDKKRNWTARNAHSHCWRSGRSSLRHCFTDHFGTPDRRPEGNVKM